MIILCKKCGTVISTLFPEHNCGEVFAPAPLQRRRTRRKPLVCHSINYTVKITNLGAIEIWYPEGINEHNVDHVMPTDAAVSAYIGYEVQCVDVLPDHEVYLRVPLSGLEVVDD